MEQVRCGIIGTGGMGTGHINMIKDIDEVVVTAICDINEEVCHKVAAGIGAPGFVRHQDLLDSGLVDMVIIATPHYFHPPIAIDAFAKGIHVLSEKPLGVTVSSVDAMCDAARKSGKQFGVVYQYRTVPSYLAVKKLIDDGELGEIYRTEMVMGWYRSQAYYNSGGWRATWSGEGGGVLINQAPHMLDMFTWLAGLPARVTGITRTRLHDIEVEDEAAVLLEYANGATGYLYATTGEVPTQDHIEICGDRGKVVMHNGQARYWKLDTSLKEFTPTTTEVWGQPKCTETPLNLIPREEGHAAITRNFAHAIMHGESLIAPGYDGINAVEMINGITMAGQTNQPVAIPVDRAQYDTLIETLAKTSRAKTAVSEQRITDPKFAK